MKKILLILFSICFILCGCNSPEWHKTLQGYYIYCPAKNDYTLEWQGDVEGCLANGKGVLVSYNKDGQIVQKEDLEAQLGVVNNWTYMPYRSYRYLGELDDEEPNGFGVLVKNDSVFIGNFKDGELYNGPCEVYEFASTGLLPVFHGALKKGKYNGVVNCYKAGQLFFEGSMKKGKRVGVGREYVDGKILYDGYYKRNLRHGLGKLYSKDGLIYDGEWKKGLRQGEGTEYNGRGLIIYEGEWKNDLYNGKGRLYTNGQCVDGKWEDGRLVKSISSSVFSQIARSTKQWFGTDSLGTCLGNSPDYMTVTDSQIEFITQLQSELNDYLSQELEGRIENRFGFWNLLRMVFQPWFSSDIKRAKYAERYFCKNLQSSDIQQWINNKIEYYNQNTSGELLHYVNIHDLQFGDIVDTNTAIKIFDREAMETTDVLVGILVDIVLCVIIAFILGLIIGLFVPELIPYAFIIDIVMGLIALGVGVYLSIFRTTTLSLELEYQIRQLMVDNYIQFLDANAIISQMLGLL